MDEKRLSPSVRRLTKWATVLSEKPVANTPKAPPHWSDTSFILKLHENVAIQILSIPPISVLASTE